ncbi:XRE family transcriptional regulator [Ktedonosporobacter rubrisoli]|uniref:XRE family transcriptional regulator n=1 Tax=Ktedonosporobacter rubrisoli TaxID=2509675 RepID=A0A4V0YYX1_KTERU|nr:helix-turn-helix transcriptional regulator [Ktedonosporobacter rubrisoli]QBD77701.1 XRE family transcriptional regulator [Ktedonosporobacter rubrisoli]
MKKASIAIPNRCLAEERIRRGWSQREVAEKLGTTVQNVCRWERGNTYPNTYFRHRLCALYEKDVRELGLSTPLKVRNQQQSYELHINPSRICRPDSLSAPLWFVPHWRNHFFTGREAILKRLHRGFQESSATCVQALGGLRDVEKRRLL